MIPEAAAPAPSRRERKKRQTRRALQRAALQLMTDRGYEHVTIEDIADAVDVSKRTFFNYFASKEQAVIGGDPEAPETVRRALAARPAGEPPLAALEAVLADLASDLLGGREDWLARRTLIRSEPRLLSASLTAWAQLERSLVDGVAQRTGLDPERDLYPALVVSVAVAATRAAAMRSRTGDETSLPDLVSAAFDALQSGLAPPPAVPDDAPPAQGAAR